MSRWAVLFRSLSTDTADTTDTTRKMEAPRPGGGSFVHSVHCVPAENAMALDGTSRLLAAALDGAQALGAPDPDLARERAEIVAARAAEVAGAFGPSAAPEHHRQALAGLLSGFAAHSRPSGEGTQP